MASINFSARVANLWKGFLSLWLEDAEKRNPEIAYQNSINSMTEKYSRLKNASSGIIRRRQELEERSEKRINELSVVESQLEQAMATDQDELGAILVQKQDALKSEIAQVQKDLVVATRDADNAKSSLLELKAEIENIKVEKDRMLAQFQSASARVYNADQLEGLSVDAEIRSLDTVRTHIKNTVAKADLNQELRDNDLDTRLAKLSQAGSGAAAQNKYAAMKAASKAKQTEGKTL